MGKKLILILSAVCVLLFLTTGVLWYMLNQTDKDPPLPTPRPGDKVETTGEYETDIFKQAYSFSEENDITNTVISPLGIKIAMAMVTEGSEEETLQELQSVLGLDEDSKIYYKEYLEDILGIEDITLNIANSTWAKQELEFKQDFMNILNQHYFAQSTNLDFSDLSSVDVINDWVSEKTNGKIDSIIERIDSDAIMFLLNAIYFNADWTEQFEEDLTQEKEFALYDGSTIMTDLMYMSSNFQYQENEQFQAVKLPYGEDERFVMNVYLPNEQLGIDAFVSNLSVERVNEWNKGFGRKKGELHLPKFKTEYSSSLNEILQALGIQKAFDSQIANLKGLIEYEGKNVYINEVKHKTSIDVSERGTEAAATTVVQIGVTSAPMENEIFEMIVDRPFFFTIEDTKYNEYLLMGTILNPKK